MLFSETPTDFNSNTENDLQCQQSSQSQFTPHHSHNDRISSSSVTHKDMPHRYQPQPVPHQLPNTNNCSSSSTTHASPSTSSASSSSSSLFSTENNNFSDPRPHGNRLLFTGNEDNETRNSTSNSNSNSNNVNANDNDTEDNYHFQQRSYSPPTPCPSIWSSFDAKYVPDSHELLQLLEPNPVPPPSYDSLPPGGCPRFPVLQPLSSFEEAIYTDLHSASKKSNTFISDPQEHTDDGPLNTPEVSETVPPPYSPSIYKIGIVSRKVEWVNPYEMSTNRSWKYLICELNSTQLNFYNIPPGYEDKILDFVSKDNKDSLNRMCPNRTAFNNSILTNDYDHHLYDFVKNHGLLEDLCTGSKKKGLVRTYSLQYARVGLATDYQKRVNVLRLRIESEQILLHFECTQDLIDWNTSLSVGKDIAIDINERESPKYRTVPRRRRRGGNRRNSNRTGNTQPSSSSSSATNFSRYNSTYDQLTSTRNMIKSASDANKIKDRFNKLRSKFSSSRLRSSSYPSPSPSPSPLDGTSVSDTYHQPRLRSNTNFPVRSSNNMVDCSYVSQQGGSGGYSSSITTGRNQHQPSYSSSYANSFEDDGDDVEDYDEEFNEVLRRSRHEMSASASTPQGVDDDQEDIQSMSDLRLDEDEEDGSGEGEEDHVEEEEEGYREDTDGGFVSMARSRGVFPIGAAERKVVSHMSRGNADDHKWDPRPNEAYSKRRYYRNCLRCIKPLTMEESWVYKPLVKPTPFSPLNVAYLKAVKYAGPNGEVMASASVSVPNSSVSSSSASFTSVYRKNAYSGGSASSSLMLPDTALTKLPNHFLKEFSVGPHGLVPREII
ncbi:hypothetical protein KGF57_001302 [Candida theae]|uniref:PH domain-containing protein n=1 Tax=Candida theae TaxID=1198502 RepID=A0AAD5BHX2_9ASCO|nr:uncharacterized protein KGF57_001302 [Candida theae]KAI5963357.1 hypothetical protein KGF57_001302 [Candida theae]